jgi:protein SCO1/2
LFLRGDEAEIYNIAKTAYLSYVAVDSTAPGGFLHSGHLILLDQDRKIRGVYDGTSADEVARLLLDLPKLLN